MKAGRYDVGVLIGRGGMAEVYEGVARGTGGFVRRVALKRLLPEVSDDAHLVRMFLDEARTASRLLHSGIVAVLDFVESDWGLVQVLELVDGHDAGWHVRRAAARGERIPVEVALHVASEVAFALAYAHEAKDDGGQPLGIVHRDVKPSNVLVAWNGDVKLGDFGIALARERCAKTTGLVVRGTPAYMSPEQLVGGAVDASTDVFALGCTLHALLVGQSPLTEESRAQMLQGGELTLSDALPEDVCAIVARAVRRRPEDRYASAREMAREIGVALAARLETDGRTRLVAWLSSAETEGAARAKKRPRAARPVETLVTMERADGRRVATRVKQSARRAPRARPFVIGLCGTLLVGAVGVLGVWAGRRLGGPDRPEAGRIETRASVTVSVDDGGTDARATEDEDAVVSAVASAPSSPAPSAPYDRHCLCLTSGADSTSLCDPAEAPVPVCRCGEGGNPAGGMCWSPMKEGASSDCTMEKALPVGTRAGEPCTGYPRRGESVDGGLRWHTEAPVEGRITWCTWCRKVMRVPRRLGDKCVGIRPDTGKLAEGRIDCRPQFDSGWSGTR